MSSKSVLIQVHANKVLQITQLLGDFTFYIVPIELSEVEKHNQTFKSVNMNRFRFHLTKLKIKEYSRNPKQAAWQQKFPKFM